MWIHNGIPLCHWEWTIDISTQNTLFKTQEQTMTCQYIFRLPNLKAEVSFECYSSLHPFVHKPSYLLVETIRPIQANLGQSILG